MEKSSDDLKIAKSTLFVIILAVPFFPTDADGSQKPASPGIIYSPKNRFRILKHFGDVLFREERLVP